MENYIVSARKYRPTTFQSVVGQKSITTTLKNAIKSNQLAHAYLFCGPRGVGKTTCARIFAKTINCTNLSSDYEACNECESCLAFNQSRSYNIHELDAASNNSVEDIRNLIDQVRVPPQVGKYSVYIIDEVHMLSSQAFNAFLKTLEEPPPHAIFVMATTEKHKILPTILSRCQIFDFKRITVEDAVEHLAYVAQSENIEAEPEGLNVIAQKADGAMRDALSLFDQIVSFSGKKITYQNVIENLNVLDYDYYFKLIELFLEGNIPQTLLIFDEILDKGFDGHHFITGLSAHLRDLLVASDAQTLELLEVGASIRENYKRQAQQAPREFLLKALTITSRCDLSYKTSSNQRLHVELALIHLCKIQEEKKKEQELIEAAKTAQKSPAPSENQKQNEQNTTNSPEAASPAKPLRRKKPIPKIKEALNGDLEKKQAQQSNQVTENTNNYGQNEFSPEEMKKIWLDFAESIQKTKPRLANTLKAHIPEIKDNFLLDLQLNNSLQQQALNNIRNELLGFLRKNLKNSKIEIKTIIPKKAKKKTIYTNSDKYQYLSEKNEKLNQLKSEFDLDFS